MAFEGVFDYTRNCVGSHTTLASSATLILAISLLFYLLYRAALPRPLPNIPYNEASARNPFGDVPAAMSHIANDGGDLISYLQSTLQNLNAPLIQVFIHPFSKPRLILSDYKEAYDILVRRTKDFDRSTSTGDPFRGLGPAHHIQQKTTPAWRSQRRLIQDLMTPSFLHEVAGPAIHRNASSLIDLWRSKSRVADGRPWSAFEDIGNVSLDAVIAFTYGDQFSQRHNATRANLEAVRSMHESTIQPPKSSNGLDEPIKFPSGDADELIGAIMELVGEIEGVQGSPFPDLQWVYNNWKPRIRKATRIKEYHITNELKDALGRMKGTDESFVKSALDHMVFREKGLAEKDRRPPDYFSRIMIDEIFGFTVAGNDTSGTAISWAVKYLAEYGTVQTKLRNELEAAFTAAASYGGNPTTQEITATHLHYLDAFIEETLRYSASVPVVERQATVDTQLLGHHVKRGTVITCLVTGPSMMSPAFDIEESRRSEGYRAAKDDSQRELPWNPSDMAFFNPDRWLVAGKFDRNIGPQMAFGMGTRQCCGKRLAYTMLRIIITLIVWNFELLPCPPALSGHKRVLILASKPRDCYVRLREINRGKAEA